jgi:hypothetical protein
MKILPQGSFPNQDEKEVIELLKRKNLTGKLSHIGQLFISEYYDKDKKTEIIDNKIKGQ